MPLLVCPCLRVPACVLLLQATAADFWGLACGPASPASAALVCTEGGATEGAASPRHYPEPEATALASSHSSLPPTLLSLASCLSAV